MGMLMWDAVMWQRATEKSTITYGLTGEGTEEGKVMSVEEDRDRWWDAVFKDFEDALQ
jgi:hypothetical protein